MGMTCTLYRVASPEVDALKNDPVRVRQIVDGRGEDWIVRRPTGLIGFLLRFTPISVESVTAKEPLTDEGLQAIREMECDLEGTWQGLHFFTGTAWDGDEPACYLIRGGEAVADDDFEDPPRLLQPELTTGFSRFLGTCPRMNYDADMNHSGWPN